ncbi:MAG: sugar phosphate nucleotidyltransferase [Vicinamibacteria bacterium]
MVLAAGYGLRMRPLTRLVAKPALPVLNRPLLHWTLERLARAGVREVIVNTHHLADTVESAARGARGLGLKVRTVREEPEILGTGGGPRAVRDWLGKGPVLLVNGDVLFTMDLRALVARHRARGARATLALRPNPGGYSPVVSAARTGRILAIAGRPRPAEGTISMFASVHVLDPALLERLPEGPCDSVLDLYIPMLGRGEAVHGGRVFGAWYDLGRPSLYRDAQLRLLPGGRSLVEDGARVSSAAVVRRAVVGARARVAAGAAVESSVLWERASVEAGARVSRSIVTAGAVVRRGERAAGVIVLPAAALEGGEAGGAVERHGDMAWVSVQ